MLDSTFMENEIKIARLEEMLSKVSERKSRAEKELRAATDDEVALRRVLEMVGVDSSNVSESEGNSGETNRASSNSQSDDSASSKLTVEPSTNGYARKIRITQELRNLVPEIEGRFQPPDATRWLQEKYPYANIRHTSVAGAVWRMADRGEGIRLVEHGYGSEPNTYEKIPQDDIAQNGLEGQEDSADKETVLDT